MIGSFLMESRAWTATGWTMLHFLWVGALLVVLAAAGRWFLRSARPDLRYCFALLCLAAMAVAPCVIATRVLQSLPPSRQLSPLPLELDVGVTVPNGRQLSTVDAPTEPRPIVVNRLPVTRGSQRALWDTIAAYVPWLWLVGTPIVFLTVASGLTGAERLRRQSRLVDQGDLPALCRRLAGTLKIAQSVAVGVCDRLASPILVGIVRSIILLPPAALTGWSPQQLEMILLHELAHVRRWDNLVNLMQRIVESLLFFQPAVWWVSRWVRLEREYCCDAIVVAQTGQPYAYAESLAALAMPGITARNAVVAMSDANLVSRIRHILDVEETSMKLSKRVLTVVTVLLFLPVIMAGYAAQASVDHSTVTVAVSDVTIVKPRATEADKLVFLPLASFNADGELEGRLAHSWEESSDHRERTYHLRTDVRWHDGTQVTAHDVKFTLDLLSHLDVQETLFESVTVLDEFTVKVRAREHAYLTEIVFYPRHLLEHLQPQEFFDWDFWTHPVGNGPYRFVRYLPETMIEFEANPDYYRGEPAIERLVFKFVGGAGLTELLDSFGGNTGIERVAFKLGGGVPLLELLSGNVDALEHINLADIPRLADDPRFRLYYALSPRRTQIFWNHRHLLFREPAIRRALTLAIDRRELHRTLNLPDNLPLTDGIYTPHQFRQRRLDESLAHDPRAAEALLREAGWRRPSRTDLCERNGEQFRFHAIVPGKSGPLLPAAIFVQDQLRRVGIQMEIETLESRQVRERLRAGEFEAGIHWTGSGPGGDAEFLGEDSSTGYATARVNELLNQALVEVDLDELDRIYLELSEIIRSDIPVTFLFPEVKTSVAHRRIGGLSSPFRANPVFHLEDLWLEDEN